MTNLRQIAVIVTLCLTVSQPIASHSIVGKVVDKAANEPIGFATIYLANTTIGAISNVDGSFEIRDIPNGRYDLVVSCVGYQRLITPVELQSDSTISFDLLLIPDLIQLSEVVVVPDSAERAKYLPVFLENFLGSSSYAKSCKIENLDDVHLYFDKGDKKLYAYAKEPVVVTNDLLGLRLYYDMVQFELSLRNHLLYNFGIYRFEFDSSVSKPIAKNRKEIYKSSMLRFLHTLYDRDELFRTYRIFYSSLPTSEKVNGPKVARRVNKQNINDLVSVTERNQVVVVPGEYRLEIKDADEMNDYPNQNVSHRPLATIIVKKEITVYPNGQVEDTRDILVLEYWSWFEKIAHALPLGYRGAY